MNKTKEQILEEIFFKPESQSWYAPVLKAMDLYAAQFEQSHKLAISCKLTDDQIWQCVEWIDKRCNFTDHQKDYVWFAIRQILKQSAGASGALAKGVCEECGGEKELEHFSLCEKCFTAKTKDELGMAR